MKFLRFTQYLSKINNQILLGTKAHDLVLDTKVRDIIFENKTKNEKPKKSAVLALIYPNNQGEAMMAFILRKSYEGYHSGQIAFPGGKVETADNTLYDTALREANEEVNIAIADVKYIKNLTSVFIPVSNYMVYPFLAYADKTPHFIKDPIEVDEILQFPLSQIINNPLVPIQKEYFGKEYTLNAFKINNYLIWGATAMILAEIKALFTSHVS